MISSPYRIAIYARYSTDLQNPSSIDDQVTLCRSLISDQLNSDPHAATVFSDAALSGASMERPGILRLLAAAKTGRINLVVAEGLDRLSRNMKDIAAIHEMLGYHGASIWTAHEGRITELHVGLKGTMNALFLRDMKAKVKRGQAARVAAGFAAGSRAYGYRVVRGVVDAQGRGVNGVREVDETQAEVIRRIYHEFAEGKTIPEIIAGLNRDGIPAPAGGLWKRNSIMGGVKKQEGILRNEIYLGMIVANRYYVTRDPVTAKKRLVLNPESKWTKVSVPHLRIITGEQWAAVRKRDARRVPKAGPSQPRVLTVHNQHALTGWVKCGWCGGPKSLANDSRYLCSTHRYARNCKNSRGTKEDVLMDAAFKAIYARINDGKDFRPLFVKAFTREAKKRLELEHKEKTIRARVERLLMAIERGVNEDAATQRVLTLQDEAAQIRASMRDLPSGLPDPASIRAQLRHAVQAVELTRDVVQMRLLFQCVLREIVLSPISSQRCGETIHIALREEGWAEFWTLIP